MHSPDTLRNRAYQIKNREIVISHTTELSEHPDKHATRGSSGIPGIQVSGSLSVSDYLHGTTLFYTWKKHPRQLDISQDTVTKLCEVRDLMFSGLAGAAENWGFALLKRRRDYPYLATSKERYPDGARLGAGAD